MKRYGPTETIGGVTVAPACGRPPLTTRNLAAPIARWETDPLPFAARPQIGWCYGTNYVALASGLIPPRDPNNKPANFISGTGLTCSTPPAGYIRHGYADPSLGVPGGIYPTTRPNDALLPSGARDITLTDHELTARRP